MAEDPETNEDIYGFDLWPDIAQRRRAYIVDMVLDSNSCENPDQVLTLCACLDTWIANGSPSVPPLQADGNVIPLHKT